VAELARYPGIADRITANFYEQKGEFESLISIAPDTRSRLRDFHTAAMRLVSRMNGTAHAVQDRLQVVPTRLTNWMQPIRHIRQKLASIADQSKIL
jgi:hypothetical protein